MQQRRLRPGDVLDDYCPRERRITDHAIVAMIDDTIQQTRCVVCDAEHEYKQAKVPAQRRKKAPALFNQVLEGLKAPARPVQVAEPPSESVAPASASTDATDVASESADIAAAAAAEIAAEPAAPTPQPEPVNGEEVATPQHEAQSEPDRFDGPFRRQLIRAALPRPEGVTPPSRAMPEFTIRQPMGRPNRHGRRRSGQGGHGHNGPMRFGRGGGGHGQHSSGHTRSGGHGANGKRAGSRRGGKKR